MIGFKHCCQIALLLCVTGCVSIGDRLHTPQLTALTPVERDFPVSEQRPRPTLTLVTLNLAHGRRDNFSQFFLGAKTIRNNLDAVAAYLRSTDADVVALQEADGPSRWSGHFDHVDYLAMAAGFGRHVRAEHVNNWFGDYGTGVLSQLPIMEGFGATFQATPPTTRKGFTLASLSWRYRHEREPIVLDIISLHLDFLSESNRKRQIQQLRRALQQRANPTVIMGDFNSEWIATHFATANLAGIDRFTSYRTHHRPPFSFGRKKLDWVLLSDELTFVEYAVDPVKLSDHRPVRATIAYRATSERPERNSGTE